ncbi:MAG: TatD family hydrolase [Dysgonamonadaceae bacterium]|jgi:TatD DNase family protein|nr:TatD family hydrolase [Dysgonamonadaceae bacterium]
MYFVDTHTHIFLEEFDSDVHEVIRNARAAGVNRFCLPNIDLTSIDRLHALSDQYPEQCYPMLGLHPTSVGPYFRKELTSIGNWFGKRKYIAIGEIGIDLYWDKTFLREQIAAFEMQLGWSIERNLPVVIHTREAFPEVFESIHKVGADQLRGVFHSFGGSREELEEIARLQNFMIGINGVVTYKNAKFQDYLALFPLERVLLETDAPYLTPVPHRGKRNEPGYLPHIAGKLSEIYGLSLEIVAGKTTDNARRLFGLSFPCRREIPC